MFVPARILSASVLALSILSVPALGQSLPGAPQPVPGGLADDQAPANITFSNNWQAVGMAVNEAGNVSVAWFQNVADGRLVVCRHDGDMSAPPRCSPPAGLR